MHRYLLALGIFFALHGVAFGASKPPAVSEYFLVPSAACTKKICHPIEPCCNTCQFQGWFDKEFNVQAVSKDLANPLPACQPDGCGACPFTLKVKGYPDNFKKPKKLFVMEWTKAGEAVPYQDPDQPGWCATPSSSASQQENPSVIPVFPGQGGSSQLNDEERKKAVETWMKDLKAQSDANMEKLKKENPEQYQQLQKFMDMLKNAASAAVPSVPNADSPGQ